MANHNGKGFQFVKLSTDDGDESDDDDHYHEFRKTSRGCNYKKIFCLGLAVITFVFVAYIIGILLFVTINGQHRDGEVVSTQKQSVSSTTTINDKTTNDNNKASMAGVKVTSTSTATTTSASSRSSVDPSPIIPPIHQTTTANNAPSRPDLSDDLISSEESSIEWTTTLYPATSELSPVVIDINHDGTLDLLVAHGLPNLEAGKYELCPGEIDRCMITFGYSPCRMRLLALDGSNGSVIWQTRLDIIPFAANCRHDMNNDGRNDCILSGRDGSLALIDMIDGSIIWVADPRANFPPYSFYYPYVERDFDNDGAPDLIVTHGGDQAYEDTDIYRSPGLAMIISGRTGQLLSERILMPDGAETYSNPILYNITGTIEVVLFGSGGETLPGSLWAITLQSLQEHVDILRDDSTNDYTINKQFIDAQCYSNNDAIEQQRPFYHEQFEKGRWDQWMLKCPRWSSDVIPIWNIYQLCVYEFVPTGKTGTMVSPVIIDFNKDGVLDILVSQFNDHLILIDGATSAIEWDHDVKDTQMYSIPAPVFFNNDDIPDYLVKSNKGVFPYYNLSTVGVMDGSTRNILWSIDCIKGGMSSGVTIASSTNGEDGVMFLGVGCNKHGLHNGELASQDVCPRRYVDAERAICLEQDRRNRNTLATAGLNDQDNINIDGTQNEQIIKDYPDYDNSYNLQPNDLWVIQDDSDWFPNPWNETRSFIQDYCQMLYDHLTVQLYFVTSSLANSQYPIRPLFEMTPYVHKPTADMKRHSNGNDYDDIDEFDYRKKLRCTHVMGPSMLTATPVVEDFNKDGELDAAFIIPYYSMSHSITQPPKITVHAFTIKDKLKEIYGPDILDTVDFSSFYPSNKQPWTQYMGTNGNAVYTSTFCTGNQC